VFPHQSVRLSHGEAEPDMRQLREMQATPNKPGLMWEPHAVDLATLHALDGDEKTVIPDYLIIEEIRRRREDTWEPEPLHLPLYVPMWPPEEEEPDEEEPSSRVIIIDMVGEED